MSEYNQENIVQPEDVRFNENITVATNNNTNDISPDDVIENILDKED